ncbi:RND multidrug efflux transporter [Paenibacillus sp. JCM 10914]|nr:RND multidrug efflux transporter [Paenibacillus sp. JCM 10914]
MKGIINFSLRNKFAIWLLTIIVSFGGLYSGLTMKQETIPDINVPFLSVTAIYPGAAPEGVVEEVTKPLETRLRNIDGVKTVTSTSMENAANVMVEFDYGADLDNATAAVREALNEVPLPDDAMKPSISKFSMSSMPVVSLSISNKDNMALDELTRITENDIVPVLEDLDGVASVQVAGQFVNEVQLTFDQDKMNELGLTEDTVRGIVQGSALYVPLGMFEMDKSQKAVAIDGGIIGIDDLKNIAIPVIPGGGGAAAGAPGAGADQGQGAAPGGADTGAPGANAGNGQGGAPDGATAPEAGAGGQGATPGAGAGIPTVKLSEIANIEVIGTSESISRTNGAESIGIQIVKANDANTVDVVNSVKDTAEELRGLFPGMDLTIMLDQGKPIEDSVHTMLFKALYGALFAVLIIMIFLRNIRSTIISIISIPLSLLIAILCLRQMDITLNMMSLGAMTVAIGRVVDDSIVVIENIYRRMSLSTEKLSGRELISAATREMFVPILSSTIVTIAVFLPLTLVSGMVGELFMPFALTMVFALLASLVVAVTLVPAMAHSLFRNGLKNKNDHHDKPGAMARGYRSILKWTLNHKAITFLAAILLLVGSLFLTKFLGVSFIPEQEDKYVMVTYSPEPGVLLEDVEERALKAEEYILDQSGVQSMQYSIGGSNPMGMGNANSGLFYIMYDPDTKDFENVKKSLVEGLTAEVPDGTWSNLDMAAGMGGGGLTVNVFGDNLDQIKPVADQIAELANQQTDTFENAKTSLSEAFEQYTLVADQEKLSSLGLTAGQLAMKLSPVRERPVLTEIEIDNKNYKVYIESDNTTYTSIEQIENETVTSPLGMEIPIKEVAKVEQGTTPDTITRINGKMVVTVSADILTADVGTASNNLQSEVDKIELPDGVSVQFGGVTEQINETFGQLGLAMLAAIAIVYFVLVVTFGGGLAPFAILFSLPFIVIGAIIGLLITGETLNVSSLMGVLMLIGIVVTNAIVLIDRVIHMERDGMTHAKPCLKRERPVFVRS